MIKVYTGFKGFAFFFLLLAGLLLFMSVFCWGFAKVIQLLLPVLIVLAYLDIIVFLLGILPATFFKDMRPTLGVASTLMAHALGLATWLMSFFFVIKAFGLLGIFLVFLLQFMAPVALMGALIKGAWSIAAHLSIWIAFSYAMRYYSQWLMDLNSRQDDRRNIIDVDAVEIVRRIE